MNNNLATRLIQIFENYGVEDAFCLTGGHIGFLLDSISKSKINTTFFATEQAAAMAADAYYRVKKKPALLLVSNGPAVTNTITGIAGAWIDSIPIIIVSGQSSTRQILQNEKSNVRQIGVQEINTENLVKSITSFFIRVTESIDLSNILNYLNVSKSNRTGPIWIEFPINIQSLIFNEPNSVASKIYSKSLNDPNLDDFKLILDKLKSSEKPLVVYGNGIHLSNTEKEFELFVDRNSIPLVSTWNATDILRDDHNQYIGSIGIFGDRAANFAIQNCDFLLILGTRLNLTHVGYNSESFSKDSYKVMVDIDSEEMNKSYLLIDLKMTMNLKSFFSLFGNLAPSNHKVENWINSLRYVKKHNNVWDEPHTRVSGFINSYDLMKFLSLKLNSNEVIVTDMGTSFTCTMQSLKNYGFSRLFTSSGLASMGFGIPAAIGASTAVRDRKIISVNGDGGIMMNLQELETIVREKVNAIIIVLVNEEMRAISSMQDRLFEGNRFGSDKNSGFSTPNFVGIFKAFGIECFEINDLSKLEKLWGEFYYKKNPIGLIINMVQNQEMIPRVQSGINLDGTIFSPSLDAMYPFKEIESSTLNNDEMKSNDGF